MSGDLWLSLLDRLSEGVEDMVLEMLRADETVRLVQLELTKSREFEQGCQPALHHQANNAQTRADVFRRIICAHMMALRH